MGRFSDLKKIKVIDRLVITEVIEYDAISQRRTSHKNGEEDDRISQFEGILLSRSKK